MTPQTRLSSYVKSCATWAAVVILPGALSLYGSFVYEGYLTYGFRDLGNISIILRGAVINLLSWYPPRCLWHLLIAGFASGCIFGILIEFLWAEDHAEKPGSEGP